MFLDTQVSLAPTPVRSFQFFRISILTASLSPHNRDNIVVADMVADMAAYMEVDNVADKVAHIVVDMAANKIKCIKHELF